MRRDSRRTSMIGSAVPTQVAETDGRRTFVLEWLGPPGVGKCQRRAPRQRFVAPRVGNGAVRIWPYAGETGYPALLIVTSDRTFTIVTT
jgi:hypothetical protein